MLVISAVLARKFNSTTCESLGMQLATAHVPRSQDGVKTGKLSDAKKLIRKFVRMLNSSTPKAVAFREIYEEVTIVHKNRHVRTYKFRDPVEAAKRQATRELLIAKKAADYAQSKLDVLRQQDTALAGAQVAPGNSVHTLLKPRQKSHRLERRSRHQAPSRSVALS